MGRKSRTGGVIAAGKERIRFDFKFEGIRYRPTLRRVPSETNLRHAREHLVSIKERIARGTFSFAEEFPDYRNLNEVPHQGSPRTCMLLKAEHESWIAAFNLRTASPRAAARTVTP